MKKNIILIAPVWVLVFLISGCSLRPLTWVPQDAPSFTNELELNERLQSAESIDLAGYFGAEEITTDSKGNIYCGAHVGPADFSSGAIIQLSSEGKSSVYMETDAWVTGMAFDEQDDLYALINGLGLIRIHPDKSIDTLLTQTPDGKPILMGTGLKLSSDGKVYFANMSGQGQSSSKYFNKLILEMRPTGGLYAYDIKSGSTEVLSEGNYFANGLELSPNEDYLLLTETSRYRILRYWLKGDQKGQSEVFMDNLPGFPNNILLRDNGHYWLGFTTKRSQSLDDIHPKEGMKKFVYSLPAFLQPKAEPFGMVLEIDKEGNIIDALFDPEGRVVKEAGAVLEHEGALYLGGDAVSYISKVSL